MELKNWLKIHSACPYGFRWVLKTGATFENVWDNCPNVAWLNWLLDSTLCEHGSEEHTACTSQSSIPGRGWWKLLSYTATGTDNNLAYLGNFWNMASRGLFDNSALETIRKEYREYWHSQLPRLKTYK